LTKLDLMDRGTDARELFTGESADMPHLKLGYVGVVNRSQADINERKTIVEARAAEMAFFQEHQAYGDLASRLGTAYLVEMCSKLLGQHIAQNLPKLAMEMSKVIQVRKQELDELCEDTPETKRRKLIEALVLAAKRFVGLLDGTVVDVPVSAFKNHTSPAAALLPVSRAGITTPRPGDTVAAGAARTPPPPPPPPPQLRKAGSRAAAQAAAKALLSGGARIEGIFADVFGRAILDVDVLDDLSAEDIQAMIRNVRGLGGGVFTPDAVFQRLTKENVGRLREPSLGAVEATHAELMKIAEAAIAKIDLFDKYKPLGTVVHSTILGMLQENLDKTLHLVSTLIDMELIRINVNHPDFLSPDQIRELMGEAEEDVKSADGFSAGYGGGGGFSADPGSRAGFRPGMGSAGDERMSSVEMRGILAKKAGFARTVWSPRVFIIHFVGSNTVTLEWYRTEDRIESAEPRGVMSLRGASVEKIAEPGHPFSLLVTASKGASASFGKEQAKKLIVAAESEGDRSRWLSALLQASTGSSNADMAERKEAVRIKEQMATAVQKNSTQRLQQQQQEVSQPQQAMAVRTQRSISTVIHEFTESLSHSEKVEVEVVCRLVNTYFDIVRKSVMDLVPKAITLRMVQDSSDKLVTSLLTCFDSATAVERYMKSSPEIEARVKALSESLELMEDTLAVIEDMRKRGISAS